jgi:hypothetical protein
MSSSFSSSDCLNSPWQKFANSTRIQYSISSVAAIKEKPFDVLASFPNYPSRLNDHFSELAKTTADNRRESIWDEMPQLEPLPTYKAEDRETRWSEVSPRTLLRSYQTLQLNKAAWEEVFESERKAMLGMLDELNSSQATRPLESILSHSRILKYYT